MPNNTVTLTDLIAQVRQRADMESSSFVTDAEIQTWINSALAELHDLMVMAFEDYYVTEHTPYTLPGTGSFDLPDDFYKALGVDFTSGGITTTVRPYAFAERNMYRSNAALVSGGIGSVRYNIQGNKIKFLPEGTPSGTAVLHYIPECQQFTTGSEQLQSKAKSAAIGYQDYLVVSAAVKCAMKEESDVKMLMIEKGDLRQRIERAATTKDAGSPHRIVDSSIGVRALF